MGLNLGANFRGYGIHGTIKPHEIGRFVSNGCIRMYNNDIENYIFPAAAVGMPVYIGKNQDLNSLGIYQYYEVVDPNKEAKKDETTKIEKPKVEMTFESGDLLEY